MKDIHYQYKYNPWQTTRCPSIRQIGYSFKRIRTHLEKNLSEDDAADMLYLINRYGCMIARRSHLKPYGRPRKKP